MKRTVTDPANEVINKAASRIAEFIYGHAALFMRHEFPWTVISYVELGTLPYILRLDSLTTK